MDKLEANLALSLSNDQSSIDAATDFIQSVKAQPDGILAFMRVIGETRDLRVRHAAIVNMASYVNTLWSDIPIVVQTAARDCLIQILQIPTLSAIEAQQIADTCAVVLASMIAKHEFWSEIVRYIAVQHEAGNFSMSVLVLSRVFPVFPDNLIAESFKGFRNMAYVGLNSDSLNTCFNAISVFFKIASVTVDADILNPVITFLSRKVEVSQSFDDADFDRFWATISRVISFDGISDESIPQFFTPAMGFITGGVCPTDRKLVMLDAFLPVIPRANPQMMHVFVSCSIALAVDAATRDHVVPDSYLCMPEKALSTRQQIEMVQAIQPAIESLLGNGGLGQVTVAIMLLAKLVTYCHSSLKGAEDFVRGSLMTALACADSMVQLATLTALCDIRETRFIANSNVDFLRAVLQYIKSPDEAVRTSAYNTLMTLCEGCDGRIEGLLDAVWAFHEKGEVAPDDAENYVLLVATIMNLATDINDGELAKIASFTTVVLNPRSEPATQAAGLSLISSLLSKRETLAGELLPMVVPVLNNCLAFENDDVVCQALSFIRNFVTLFKAMTLSFIEPYVGGLVAIVRDGTPGTRRFGVALRASSSVICAASVPALLEAVLIACATSVNSDDIEGIVCGCETVAHISRALAVPEHTERVVTIFKRLCDIVEIEDEVDVINAALEALAKLLRRCRVLSPGPIDELCGTLFGKVLTGSTKYLTREGTFPKNVPGEFVQYMSIFMAIYTRNATVGVADLCTFVIKSLSDASEDTAASLLAVPIDAVQYNTTFASAELSAVLMSYVSSVIASVQDVDLRQQIAVVLATLLDRQIVAGEAVAGFLPVLNKWWEEGRAAQTGHTLCISNIALLYLRLAAVHQIDTAVIVNAICAYPPADLSDTETMSRLLLARFQTTQSGELCAAFITSTANLLSEPEPTLVKRKLQPETRAGLETLFRAAVAGNESAQASIQQQFAGNSQRLAAIALYLKPGN